MAANPSLLSAEMCRAAGNIFNKAFGQITVGRAAETVVMPVTESNWCLIM